MDSLVRALGPLDYVRTLWEGGALGFDRVDEWSDIDLGLIVADHKVEEAFAKVEVVLHSLSGIELKYRLPEPTWHGSPQCFYRLKDASEFLLIDLCVMGSSDDEDLLPYEIHGVPTVHIDKDGAFTGSTYDRGKVAEAIEKRLEQVKVIFDMFQILTLKELNRHNDIEAMAFYFGYTFKPLLEVLRMKHCPQRYNYATRYVYYDLPEDVVKRLEPLIFVSGPEGLREAFDKAGGWFWEVIGQINMDDVRRRLVEV
jgi:hypothetical protein